jgi:hypothetical protein
LPLGADELRAYRRAVIENMRDAVVAMNMARPQAES